MRNEKGLTLVEVLGSIILLGVAVLGITFILQQASAHTKANEKTDRSVVLTRNTMEQIKQELRTSQATITLYGQSLSLQNLRAMLPVTLYYPDASDPAYTIAITSSHAGLGFANAAEQQVNLDGIFRQITVRTTEAATNKTYELTAYVEYQ